MCYNQTGDISTLDEIPLKLGSRVASTEKDIDTRLMKAWTAINRLSIIWKSDLTDKMKCSFLQAAVASILLYGCTTWTLTKRLEKKLDGNYTRMLRAILNKSWWQHPTRHQLYGHLPPITKTIQVRRTRHAGHYWRSRDELISDVLLWTPTHGRAKAGRPARTYIQQLCEDTGCCPEDLPEAMNDREKWRERVRDIRATSTTWWWWWYNDRWHGFWVRSWWLHVLWQAVTFVLENRLMIVRRDRPVEQVCNQKETTWYENYAVSFRQSVQSESSRAGICSRSEALGRLWRYALQGGANVGIPWLQEEDMGQEEVPSLSICLSIYLLNLKQTAHLFENKMRDMFL